MLHKGAHEVDAACDDANSFTLGLEIVGIDDFSSLTSERNESFTSIEVQSVMSFLRSVKVSSASFVFMFKHACNACLK